MEILQHMLKVRPRTAEARKIRYEASSMEVEYEYSNRSTSQVRFVA